jgi:ribosomal protein L5
MLSSFQLFISTPLVREKLYKGFPRINTYSSFLGLDVSEIKLMFLLSNNLSNKSMFFALLLLLEKMTLTTFSFVITKKSIANFNIKKQLKIGAVYTLTHEKKNQFVRLFTAYSLKKIDVHSFFYFSEGIRFSFNKQVIALGLQRILFNLLISVNAKDYDLFAPLFENMVYGVHIYFYTNFRNFFINRLLLSQYNILVA